MKKNIKLSILTIISVMGLAHAGGDITPITTYETTDVEEANLEAVEVVKKEEEEPIVVPPKQNEDVVVTPDTKEPVKEAVSGNSGVYIGLGGVAARYDTNCDCDTSGKSGTDKTGGVVAKVGYDINRYIGVEARGISTMVKDDGAKVTHYGAYVKPMLPITDDIKAYGLVGYGKSETSGHLRKSDVDGLAWGAGLDYDITDNVSAFVDYQKLINKSDSDAPKLDTLSVGANYKF